MKKSMKPRNVKALVSVLVKGDMRLEGAIKNPPNLKPKNKRAK